MGRRCKHCGAYLDPGEKCECDGIDVPEMEEAQRPCIRTSRRKAQETPINQASRYWMEWDKS